MRVELVRQKADEEGEDKEKKTEQTLWANFSKQGLVDMTSALLSFSFSNTIHYETTRQSVYHGIQMHFETGPSIRCSY